MSVSNLRARGACLAEDNDISLTDVIPTALGAVAPSVPFARPDLARRLALPSADAVVVILGVASPSRSLGARSNSSRFSRQY